MSKHFSIKFTTLSSLTLSLCYFNMISINRINETHSEYVVMVSNTPTAVPQ